MPHHRSDAVIVVTKATAVMYTPKRKTSPAEMWPRSLTAMLAGLWAG